MANADDLDALLQTLSPTQLDFVQKRIFTTSDKAAAEALGIAPSTVYNWPNRAEIDYIVELAKRDSVCVAAERLRRLAGQAVDVYEDGLGGEEKLDIARDVLDRVMGKPTQRTEVSGRGGGPIEYRDVTYTDDQRAQIVSRLLDRARERVAGSNAES